MKSVYILIITVFIITVFLNNRAANADTWINNYLKSDTSKAKAVKLNKSTGIGPVKKVKLGIIDKKLADEGKTLFSDKCSACHSLDEEVEGPALRHITKKLRPEYIMNYLLNTTEMQNKDQQLKDLIKKYNGEAMPDFGLKEPQARALLEFFRQSDE